MLTMKCEQVRDNYPELVTGTLAADVAAAVRAHVASCDDCRAESALVEAVRAARARVPEGLNERIVRAAAQPRRTSFHFSAGKLALAAALAAAVIGGGILLDPGPRASQRSVTSMDHRHYGLGFVTVEDALLSGATSLDDLTIEQLETLLGELES